MSASHAETPSPLPSGHFLSLPPSFAQSSDLYPSGAPSTVAHTSNGLAPNVASLASADYDVDVRTGFLPGTNNCTRLPQQWTLWEDALVAARGDGVIGAGLRLGGNGEDNRLWRQGVEMMPTLATDTLQSSLPHLRRAHLVLSFLLHFYAHTTPKHQTRLTPLPIPESISVPLLAVSSLLGLPPVVTYSDTVLYNFAPLNPLLPLSTTNPPHRCLESFTGTRSEEQFYVISAKCEIAGADALRLMRQSLDELFLADAVAIRRLAVYLRKLAFQIDTIGDITLSMIDQIDPEEFYHLIRPWFRGGDADGPSSPGWNFVGTEAGSSGQRRAESSVDSSDFGARGSRFSGPSAGQSSLIHAIDIFLTVDHAPTTEEACITVDGTPALSTESRQPNEATFVQRMLEYMPLQHRAFLLHLASQPMSLRQLVLATASSHPKLAQAYDGALEALKRFREKHMRVVSIFIVQQARRQPSERIRGLIGTTDTPPSTTELRGTGGSPLFKFLKRCRDNTTRALIGRSTAPDYVLE